MGKQAPAPTTDYKAMGNSIQKAGASQLNANRPNQNTPFGFTTWDKGPNGEWTQNTGLNGGLAQAQQSAEAQLGARGPMDWSQFGTMGNGEDARNQAVNASYGQATSRLDPQWDRRTEAQRTQLVNQGLAPDSEAYKNAMGDLGQQRNDAYTSAMNSAQMMGQSAGDSVFRNNLAGREQSISEALRQYGQPMETLQQLQGFTQMPGFNADNSTLSAMLGKYNALAGGDQANLAQWQASQQANADIIGGIFGGLTGLGGLGMAGYKAIKGK